MRKIIVPTDFSSTAWNALLLCVRMFKYEVSEIFILHSLTNSFYSEDQQISNISDGPSGEELLSDTQKKVKAIIKKINKVSANPRHQFFSKVVSGSLVDEINDLCDQEDIDVVVMGTKGKSSNGKKAIGSNTLAVIKFIKSPVICVPANYIFEKLEIILFPTNYLISYQRRELKLVEELARRFVTQIHFLYASKYPPRLKRQQQNEQFLADFFKNNSPVFDYRNTSAIHIVIGSFLKEIKADLLVMVNSEHTYLSHILTSSTIDTFTLSGEIPLLVLQNLNRE